MAFDGITVAALAKELNDSLEGGVISRIVQPEKDELILTVRQYKNQYRVLISASASLPLVYLSDTNKNAPITAPAFCMLLRKHLQSGRILSVTQPGLERVLCIRIEHRDEMGDMTVRKLMIEIMGKYSNAILVTEDDVIIDAIKRVPSSMSSVREVLTGRPYFIPETTGKTDPLVFAVSSENDHFDNAYTFLGTMRSKSSTAAKALANTYTGISFAFAEEVCFEAGIDGGAAIASLGESDFAFLYKTFCGKMEDVRNGRFAPAIAYRNGIPAEFSALPLRMYEDTVPFDSISAVLQAYYSQKNLHSVMKQKSASLRQTAQTLLGRAVRKLDLQQKQYADTDRMDQFRIYGEMLQAFGYGCAEGAKSITVTNYYTNEPLTIPLKPDLSAQENAKRYFDRYNKLKRTRTQLTTQIAETQREADQLDSILTALDIAENESDLSEIRREMADAGFVKPERGAKSGRGGKGGKSAGSKGASKTPKADPLVYRSSDGYLMYVGKNNYQNEYVTFTLASSDDLWFHAKGIAGSHVIVKTEGRALAELPDRLFEEAGSLAAFYSKGKTDPKVEVDYITRRHIKKPNAGAPGFVIYHTNYSLVAGTDISMLERIE
ncbi:MAG: NFACT family protein [Lachnospiraceae bacterium]|nr:NFACT family protein [Lachnospiraceae bacterium]